MRPVLPLSLMLFVACGDATTTTPGTAVEASAPALGKADGADAADRGCQVILRDVARPSNNQGGYETDCSRGPCTFVWRGTVDVAEGTAGEVGVLYRLAWDSRFWEIPAEPVPASSPGGYVRHQFRIAEHTVTSGTSLTSLMRTELEVIPFLRTAAGVRLFDHNRVTGDLDSYRLTKDNSWSIADDAETCAPALRSEATLRFLGGFTEEQRGTLTAGGALTVEYDLARLPDCRGTHNGHPAWDLRAFVRFLPGGQIVEGSVRQFESNFGVPTTVAHSLPLKVQIPAGARSAELWFHNFTGAGSSCKAWDSKFGANYRFTVVTRLPEAVAWAGDWGGSFARDCTHRDGLAEPVRLDSYVRERACSFVDADVYVPGLTDASAERPEKLLAQVEYAIDGGEPRHAWLGYQGRVGNNYRYRWQLPREAMTHEPWTVYAYRFRFSTDGITWLAIGQDDGSPRTIERDPTF